MSMKINNFNNKNHSHSNSVPQNPQSGTTENQQKINLSIAFGAFEKSWEIFWASFPGNEDQLEEQQINACLDIIEGCENKGVKFPSSEQASVTLDEAQLAWYSIKRAQLMGLVGGVQ